MKELIVTRWFNWANDMIQLKFVSYKQTSVGGRASLDQRPVRRFVVRAFGKFGFGQVIRKYKYGGEATLKVLTIRAADVESR